MQQVEPRAQAIQLKLALTIRCDDSLDCRCCGGNVDGCAYDSRPGGILHDAARMWSRVVLEKNAAFAIKRIARMKTIVLDMGPPDLE